MTPSAPFDARSRLQPYHGIRSLRPFVDGSAPAIRVRYRGPCDPVVREFDGSVMFLGAGETLGMDDASSSQPRFSSLTAMVLATSGVAIGLGNGAELRAPMAVTVIGGLIVSTLLTLVVIPVVYSVLDRKTYGSVSGQSSVVSGQ